MVKIEETKGVPIICIKDDSRIGFVEGPVYDDDGYVIGFFADVKGNLFRKKFISLEDIIKIDGKVCKIYSERNVKKRRAAKGCSLSCSKDRYKGKRAMLCGGEGVGVVSDLLFNAETGEIEGLELSRGLFEDLSKGRKALLLRDCTEVGEDTIIIGDEGSLL
ncbi:MAG: PRC-barrel domain-containing protein [Clostridia bacterium]|nr:PRC-barrel domain-containing protein [Clostridia bacterium]